MDKIYNCVVCESKSLTKVIELGYHPPADTFVKNEQLGDPQKVYQLSCILCGNCGHLQNKIIVPKEERYDKVDYSYTSSNSKIAREHWEEFCDTVSTYTGLTSKDHVIEFGSNDGYLLKQFDKRCI